LAAVVGGGRVAEELVVVEGPAVHEGIAREEPVDRAVALVGGAVGQEGVERRDVGDAAGEVQRDPAEKLLVAREGRRDWATWRRRSRRR
jgi:hypothetical protein